jgi:hypothetical protein
MIPALQVLALVGSLTRSQSFSTAPVQGPSPGYNTRSDAPTDPGEVVHQARGLVQRVLPTDPSTGGERKFVVLDGTGAELTFKVDSDTLIRRQGANVSVASIRPGQQVQITYSGPAHDDGSFTATYVEIVRRPAPTHPAGAAPPRVPIAKQDKD